LFLADLFDADERHVGRPPAELAERLDGGGDVGVSRAGRQHDGDRQNQPSPHYLPCCSARWRFNKSSPKSPSKSRQMQWTWFALSWVFSSSTRKVGPWIM